MIVSICPGFFVQKNSAEQAKRMIDEISVEAHTNELSNLNGLLVSAIRSKWIYMDLGATENARRGLLTVRQWMPRIGCAVTK